MLDTDTDSTYIIDKALKLLRGELESRSSASTTFPPVLTEAQIRTSIAQYQNHIEGSSKLFRVLQHSGQGSAAPNWCCCTGSAELVKAWL
jgi:hypothetical protein